MLGLGQLPKAIDSANGKKRDWWKQIQNRIGLGESKEIEANDITSRDAIIAIMGPTGTGKSTFIEAISGVGGKAGHSLESTTQGISVTRLKFPERTDFNLCFVDTPGFDDTNKSDVQIFSMISNWLNDTYKKDIRLSGLLYFHRISDNRMGGTPLKNLRLFETLCGNKYSRIVLTTTMWDEVDDEMGSRREEELKDVFWKSMIDRGSSVKRFERTSKSAFDVLNPIFEEINKESALLLQKEVSDLRMQLNQTTAGKALYVEIEQLVSRHQSILERIRQELKDPSLDLEQMQSLMMEFQEVTAKLQRASQDRGLMHLTWLQKELSRGWLFFVRLFPQPRRPNLENKGANDLASGAPRLDVSVESAGSLMSDSSLTPYLHRLPST